MHTSREITTPMDHVQVDLIVVIPVSTEGYTAIAVSKDIHTGYIWLHPLTTKGATEVATSIMSIIQQFGPMKVLHRDNGKEFKNRVLCKITEFTRIHHQFGSSYHPRAQGTVERENAEIERLLRKMCMGAVHVWPTHLEYVASCLNSRISSVKGTSAFALSGTTDGPRPGRSDATYPE
jgi:IS30 family transposase